MHASHSHNYYFIKELPPLAGILWHCCCDAGMGPEGGWGRRDVGCRRGNLGGKGELWVGGNMLQFGSSPSLHGVERQSLFRT